MRSRFCVFVFLVLAACTLPLAADAAAKKEDNTRVAIVLASFGSTVKEARGVEATFVEKVKKRYSETHVVLANTARVVMKKNREQGIATPSLFQALAELSDQGYTHVVVQSLQIIPGAEFDGVAAIAKSQEGLPKGIKAIVTGAPLLSANEYCAMVAKALAASLPKERKASEPVVFVGHGTHHGIGGMVYPALQWHMKNVDPLIFVSTLEGTPSQEHTFKTLGKADDKKPVVWVAPLLALAGDHAVNDLYGDEDDSWKSLLAKNGWQVKQSFTPLLSIPGIQAIWFAHIDAALEKLGVATLAKPRVAALVQ